MARLPRDGAQAVIALGAVCQRYQMTLLAPLRLDVESSHGFRRGAFSMAMSSKYILVSPETPWGDCNQNLNV